MRSNRHCLHIAVALAAAGFATQLRAANLTENFNDLNAANRWNVAYQLESTRDPSTGPDGGVNFAFDYSTLGIAAPAGSTDTIGAFVQVNNTDQPGDEGESYVIFPKTATLPAGNWRLDADMFVWNDGLAGTTELGMVGAYLNPAAPVVPYQWGSDGGPLAWIYSGEGGSTADLATFKNGGPGATGYTSLGDYNAKPADSIPGFETGVAGSGGPAGTNPAGAWVRVSLVKDGNTISWLLNGAVVDTFDNSGNTYTGGTFFLGTTDPFNSSNAGGGTVIDNIVFQDLSVVAVAGDVNGDGVVNLGDINYVTARWLNAGPAGDANNDGVVNLGDINFITARWLNTSEPGGVAALSVVPEPASLSAIALAGLAAVSRRRRA